MAIEQGATVVVLEDWPETLLEEVTYLQVADSATALGLMADLYYGQPSGQLKLVGVTGTNGKTTTATLLHELFTKLGYKVGLLSTVHNRIGQAVVEATHTTPDALSIHRLLREMADAGCDYAFMEVSSHAAHQRRIAGLSFDGGIFTNISRDHLDYHGTLEAYAAAKKRLFQWPGLQHAVVNSDDAVGREIISELPAGVKLWRYSLRTPEAELYCRHIQALDAGYELNIVTPAGEVTVLLPLWGHFNIANALATLGVLLSWDIDLSRAGRILAQLKPVAGRLERFHAAGKPSVIVDYAHTPDALAQTLQAIRPHCRGRLWCVFGCGGDRDPGKRPLMGQVSARYADCSIITDDNPRHEASVDIIAAILPGLGDAPHHVIAERAAAIEFALQDAAPDDVILIAGKGHEAYQQIGAERLPFSDREIVEKYLQNTRLGATTGYDYD